MRKSFFTLMLAIVSSVWMTSKAMCQVSTCTCLFDDPPVAISGILQLVPLPCPESTEDIPCPPCLTTALIANEQLYYLNGLNDNLNALLDTLVYPVNATVTGHVYTALEGGLAISVQDISLHASLPSLCDEWNVWYESFESFGPISFDKVVKYQLTTDTLINGQQYVKLTSDKDSPYLGAMREGNNRDIYYVPSGSTHEYLLYAFNAQEGDQLNNVWLGGNPEDYPYGWTMTVEAIQETDPRTFVLSTGFITTEEGVENYPLYTTWIEGVGFPETPHEVAELLSPADVGVYTLLCAYKNKEQIYVSEMGAEYGCEHDQTPEPTDTIPLYSYTGDDPGSSTVDPVDPNQVVVTLKGDELTIREHTGVDITYSLRHNALAKMPAHSQTSASDTFRNEITLQITESGEYQLLLTNPSWDYSIYGTFFYSPQGIEQIHSSTQGGETSRLVLMNGQIYILRGEKVYTLTGQETR